MILSCRIALVLLVVFSIMRFIADNGQFTISTDLKDLSPELSGNTETQTAISKLSSHIEGQFTLIFMANEKEALGSAIREAKSSLTSNSAIKMNSSDAWEDIVAKLKKHRFHLLTDQQRKQLQSGDTAEILRDAKRNLFRMNSALQILPLTEDPLGLFAEYMLSVANKLPENADTIKISNNSGSGFYFQAISLAVRQGAMDMESQAMLNQYLAELKQDITSQFPVEIIASGVIFFASDAAAKSQADIKLISLGSGIGVVLLLLLVFLSIYALVIPVLSVAIGILFGVTMSHVFYGSVHILTIVFGASLIGVIIDYSLHYFYHHSSFFHHTSSYQNSRPYQNSSSDKKASQDQANKYLRNKLYKAMAISLITSFIGYGALVYSDLEALKKIAVFSCFGILAAWICVIALGPLVSKKPNELSSYIFSAILSTLNHYMSYLAKHTTLAIWTILLLVSAGYLWFAPLPVSDNPRLFFDPSTERLMQEKAARELTDGFEPGQYLIMKGPSTAGVYQLYAEFLKTLGEDTDPSDLFSITKLFPSPQEQAINYQLQQRLYRIPGAISELFSDIGMEKNAAERLRSEYVASQTSLLSPESLFDDEHHLPPIWMTINNTVYSFVLIRKGAETANLVETSKAFEDITYINTLELTQQALKSQRESASELLVLAYLSIASLLVIIYRSWQALHVLLVPLTATAGTLLIFTWFSVEVNLFHLMGLFLVLGLGMDYGVFSKEMAAEMAVTQNAIFLSALTTALSFGLLSLSSIPIAKAFGLTLLIGNTLNFFSALLYAGLIANLTVGSQHDARGTT